jgi:hypothetical protein
MSVTSLGMTLDTRHTIRLWASRSDDWACLAISGGETSYEIQMERIHVQALHDHTPVVLVAMDRTATQDAACERAETAAQRATDAAAEALELAEAAEAAGAHDLAASLREAAGQATEAANAVDAAVRAFGHAAADADHATNALVFATDEAEAMLRGAPDNEHPTDLIPS